MSSADIPDGPQDPLPFSERPAPHSPPHAVCCVGRVDVEPEHVASNAVGLHNVLAEKHTHTDEHTDSQRFGTRTHSIKRNASIVRPIGYSLLLSIRMLLSA